MLDLRERNPVPTVQVAGGGGTPGPVWKGAENLAPPEFDHCTVQPVASRYTDWAIEINASQMHGCLY